MPASANTAAVRISTDSMISGYCTSMRVKNSETAMTTAPTISPRSSAPVT